MWVPPENGPGFLPTSNDPMQRIKKEKKNPKMSSFSDSRTGQLTTKFSRQSVKGEVTVDVEKLKCLEMRETQHDHKLTGFREIIQSGVCSGKCCIANRSQALAESEGNPSYLGGGGTKAEEPKSRPTWDTERAPGYSS